MKEIAEFIAQCGKEDFHPMYRGQGNIDWKLTPSIGRLFNSMHNEIRYSSWESFEKSLISTFKRLSAPY